MVGSVRCELRDSTELGLLSRTGGWYRISTRDVGLTVRAEDGGCVEDLVDLAWRRIESHGVQGRRASQAAPGGTLRLGATASGATPRRSGGRAIRGRAVDPGDRVVTPDLDDQQASGDGPERVAGDRGARNRVASPPSADRPRPAVVRTARVGTYGGTPTRGSNETRRGHGARRRQRDDSCVADFRASAEPAVGAARLSRLRPG